MSNAINLERYFTIKTDSWLSRSCEITLFWPIFRNKSSKMTKKNIYLFRKRKKVWDRRIGFIIPCETIKSDSWFNISYEITLFWLIFRNKSSKTIQKNIYLFQKRKKVWARRIGFIIPCETIKSYSWLSGFCEFTIFDPFSEINLQKWPKNIYLFQKRKKVWARRIGFIPCETIKSDSWSIDPASSHFF